MSHWRRSLARLRNLFANDRAERELAREIASHIALLEDECQRRGMTPEESRREARKACGGVEQAKQMHRDERSIQWIEETLKDLRHACRTLARSPGFTFVSIATLALGVGVNTTLFTAYNAVALKPLPVSDASRVVRFRRTLQSGFIGDPQYAFSYPEYVYCRDHQSMFATMVAASWPIRVLAAIPKDDENGSREPETVQAQLVSGSYFDGLGIHTAIGRNFGPEEDRAPGASPVVVLSYAYWQRQFRGNRQIIGRPIKINNAEYTILGVTPREFTGTSLNPQVPDLWAPASMQAEMVPGQDWLRTPTDDQFQILARLDARFSMRQAQAESDALIRQFASTYMTHDRTLSVSLERTAYFGNTNDVRFEAAVAVTMVVFALILLVACANIANMLVARGAVRQREISVRMAIGASRGRVIRHLLTESLLLSLAGGVAGLALAALAGRLIRVALEQALMRQLGNDFALSLNLSPDLRVLAYAMGISLAAGVIFGLSPALQFSKPDLTTSLKDESRSFGSRVSRSRLRGVLICGQVAVSTLLLSCAGLLIRGLERSQAADPGFETHRSFLLRADFGDDAATAGARFHRTVDWLETLPELDHVARGTGPMMGTWAMPILVKREGALEGLARGRTLASYASESYLATLGIDLLRGRNFTRDEASSGAHVAVISAATARAFWPQEDPLGRRFQLDMHYDGKLTEFEVIGIARDIRFSNLTRIDPAHVYLPTNPANIDPILFTVRGDAQTALNGVWNRLRGFDRDLLPSIAIWNVDAMLLNPQRTLSRALAMLAMILALLALALAGAGIYGVMAYIVSHRTQEIGVRMALGANSAHVLKSVAYEGFRPVACGLALGLSAGAGVSYLLHATLAFPGSADFLYGVPFYDPVTFLAITTFLVFVSLAASLAPAIKAIRVDPIVALRYE